VFYTKYFARKLIAISCKFYFHKKICNYFLRKIFQNKIGRKYNFFSSDWPHDIIVFFPYSYLCCL